MKKPIWMPKFIYNWLVKKLNLNTFKLSGIKKDSNISVLKSQYLPFIDIDVKDLPSKGMFYPFNCNIKYYPYTFEEGRERAGKAED